MRKLPLKRVKRLAPKRKKAPSMSPVAALINDPCGAKIPEGFYGDDSGYLMRFRRTLAVNVYGNTDHKFGFVIWYPDYHCISNNGSATARNVNLIQFNSLDADTRPTLTGFGTQTTSTTTPGSASSFADPAYDFVVGSTCQDARTLAACLKVRYTGPTSFAQGNIFPLTNIPVELLTEPPTVQELMQYANRDVRCDDCLEIKFRPVGRASGNYHKATAGVLNTANNQAPSVPASTEQVAPSGIGFVWYDISQSDDLFYDCYKVVEWKPEVNSGIPAKQPKGGFTTELVRTGINFLDRNMPGWDTVVGSIGGGGMGQLATMLRRVVLSGTR